MGGGEVGGVGDEVRKMGNRSGRRGDGVGKGLLLG